MPQKAFGSSQGVIYSRFKNNRTLADENFVLSYLFTIFVHPVND